MGIFDLWRDVLTKPAKTFKRMKNKGGLREGAKYLVVAGVIAAMLELGFAVLQGTWVAEPLGLVVIAVLLALIFSPILVLLWWLIFSGILLLFAKLLGGKGKYATQSWLIALYSAPVLVIGAVLGLIPFVSSIADKLLWAYGVVLLGIALRETHGYNNVRTVLTLLLPFLLATAIAVIVILMFPNSLNWLSALL